MNNAIVSILSRKASSTPSLPDATDNQRASVASTEQAASADNLAAKVSPVLMVHDFSNDEFHVANERFMITASGSRNHGECRERSAQ